MYIETDYNFTAFLFLFGKWKERTLEKSNVKSLQIVVLMTARCPKNAQILKI